MFCVVHSMENDILSGLTICGGDDTSVLKSHWVDWPVPAPVTSADTGEGVQGIQRYVLSTVLVVKVNLETELTVVKLPKEVRSGGGTRMIRALQNAYSSPGVMDSAAFFPTRAATARFLAPRGARARPGFAAGPFCAAIEKPRPRVAEKVYDENFGKMNCQGRTRIT